MTTLTLVKVDQVLATHDMVIHNMDDLDHIDLTILAVITKQIYTTNNFGAYYAYDITLQCGTDTLDIQYSDSIHNRKKGIPLSIKSVLLSVAYDASCVIDQTFEEFCNELYHGEPLLRYTEALESYEACKRSLKWLQKIGLYDHITDLIKSLDQ